MRLQIFDKANLAAEAVATLIIARIKAFSPTQQRKFVLCLPTGSTPLGVYKELARRCQLGEISFEFVITFNLDEYVGLGPTNPRSYHAFMEEEFFSKVDIPPANQNLLHGLATDLQAECAAYESKIQSCGGIDLLLAGIGENGHLAFNEPGSGMTGGTKVVTLDQETREVNARFFDGHLDQVPTHALSMGVGSIMAAKEIILMANGNKKAQAVKDCFESGVNHMHPASILQLHPSVSIYTDTEAAQLLSERTIKALTVATKGSIELTSQNPHIPQRAKFITDDHESQPPEDVANPCEAKLPPLIIRLNRRGGELRVVTSSPLTPVSPE